MERASTTTGEDLAVSQLAAEDRLRHGCAHHPRSSLLLPRDISGRTSVPPRARSCKRSSSCKDVDTGHGVDMDLVCGQKIFSTRGRAEAQQLEALPPNMDKHDDKSTNSGRSWHLLLLTRASHARLY